MDICSERVLQRVSFLIGTNTEESQSRIMITFIIHKLTGKHTRICAGCHYFNASVASQCRLIGVANNGFAVGFHLQPRASALRLIEPHGDLSYFAI